MRLGSPLGLAIVGTLAIHVALWLIGDVFVTLYPYKPPAPPPRIELVDIEVPTRPPPPAPPPPPAITQPPPLPPAPEPPRRVTPRAPQPQPTPAPPPPPVDEPPPPATPTTDLTPGGDTVVTLDGVAPSATGVPVAVGHPSGHIGRGGSGGGTGSGSGQGTSPVAAPVSVATIKQRAMPRGDYGYFEAGKDYPAEARQLGIEGAIRVRLVVDDRGKVVAWTLLNRLGHGLDELALQRAAQIQFDPARDTTDRPVSSVVVWTFNMTLPK